MSRGHTEGTYLWETTVLRLDWPLLLILATSTVIVLGVVAGYVSARFAVIGSERRLNRSLAARR